MPNEMFVYNSQFINNVFFSNSLHTVFSECFDLVRNLIFLLYKASDAEQLKNMIHATQQYGLLEKKNNKLTNV